MLALVKMAIFLALLTVFCGQGDVGAKDVDTEIASPRPDIPALLVTVDEGIKTSVHEGPDFIVFLLDRKGIGPKFRTSMTVYVGQFPERLASMTESKLFAQEPAMFHYERASWFSWLANEDEGFISTAYLYNVFKSQPTPENPFMVHVTVRGRDFDAVAELKAVALKMRFKGMGHR